MTLAQVAYQLSNDADFARQFFSAPEAVLARLGFSLSKEEVSFLQTAHRRSEQEKVRIAQIVEKNAVGWRS